MKNSQTLLALWSLLLLLGCNEERITPGVPVSITGRVIEKATEAPVTEARVTILSTSEFTETDSAGYFQFEELEFQESFSLRVEKSGFKNQTLSVSFTLTGPDTREVEVPLEEDPDQNQPPSRPAAVAPVNGAAGLSIDPILRWTAPDPDEDDVVHYEVLLFDDHTPDGQLFNTTDTFLQVTGLRYDRRYYWQVIADDGVNEPVAGLVQYFDTEVFPDFRVHFVRQDEATQNFVIFGAESPFFGVEADSLRAVPITDPARSCWRPHLNLAADRIAFLSYAGSEPHLFTMNRDGSDVRQITSARPVSSFELLEINYSWSPNGGQLIYPHENKLYIINENGTGLTEFASAPLGYFFVEVDWSEQGYIAARMQMADRYRSKILVYDLNGSIVHTVINEQDPPVWRSGPVLSEGSEYVIYAQDRQPQQFPDEQPRRTWLLREPALGPGESPSQINNAPIPPNSNDLYPCLPPGGEIVMFVNRPTNGATIGDVYFMEVDAADAQSRALAFRNATMPDWQ